MFNKIGIFVVPVAITIVIGFGFFKKIKVFDIFLNGAKEGLKSTVDIAPSLVGLITAVSMIKASGALDLFTCAVSNIANFFKIPPIVMPLMILRPISGSGSLAFLDTIFSSAGVDSIAGKIASVMMGSTETTFYAIAVYFGAVGIKNTRHTIPAALLADLTGFLVSVLTVKLFFN